MLNDVRNQDETAEQKAESQKLAEGRKKKYRRRTRKVGVLAKGIGRSWQKPEDFKANRAQFDRTHHTKVTRRFIFYIFLFFVHVCQLLLVQRPFALLDLHLHYKLEW